MRYVKIVNRELDSFTLVQGYIDNVQWQRKIKGKIKRWLLQLEDEEKSATDLVYAFFLASFLTSLLKWCVYPLL